MKAYGFNYMKGKYGAVPHLDFSEHLNTSCLKVTMRNKGLQKKEKQTSAACFKKKRSDVR